MQSNQRNMVTLVLGGVRSGKSQYAQKIGEYAGQVVFVATAQACDDEMREQSRPSSQQPPAAMEDRRGASGVGRGDRPSRPCL